MRIHPNRGTQQSLNVASIRFSRHQVPRSAPQSSSTQLVHPNRKQGIEATSWEHLSAWTSHLVRPGSAAVKTGCVDCDWTHHSVKHCMLLGHRSSRSLRGGDAGPPAQRLPLAEVQALIWESSLNHIGFQIVVYGVIGIPVQFHAPLSIEVDYPWLPTVLAGMFWHLGRCRRALWKGDKLMDALCSCLHSWFPKGFRNTEGTKTSRLNNYCRTTCRLAWGCPDSSKRPMGPRIIPTQ